MFRMWLKSTPIVLCWDFFAQRQVLYSEIFLYKMSISLSGWLKQQVSICNIYASCLYSRNHLRGHKIMLLSRRFAYNRLTVLQLKPVRKLRHYLIRFVRIVIPLFRWTGDSASCNPITVLFLFFTNPHALPAQVLLWAMGSDDNLLPSHVFSPTLMVTRFSDFSGILDIALWSNT